MNIGDHTFIDCADGTVFAMGNKKGLHIPKTVYMKFNQLVQQNSFLEIGHIPSQDLWYALLGDQVVWSNQPLETDAPETETKFKSLKSLFVNKGKKKPPKKHKVEEKPKKFNRFTALIEKSDEVNPDQVIKRKIQWKD
jgi:hypothetical protein